jgi:hypothetical protein
MIDNGYASRCGVPGFYLQDNKICIKEQKINIRNIRHSVKPMLSVGSGIIKDFFWSNVCLLQDCPQSTFWHISCMIWNSSISICCR